MATNSTHSLIASTGGDYSSPQAWEDDIGVGLGTSTNLVTDDYDHYGYVAAEEFTVSGSANMISFGGLTTDNTHRVYLKADTASRPGGSGTPTNASLFDHPDVPLVYVDGMSYASFRNTNVDAGNDLIVMGAQYTVIEGLCFKHSRRSIFGAVSGPNGIVVKRCYFEHKNGCISVTQQNNFHYCFFRRRSDFSYTPSGDGTIRFSAEQNVYVYNCTFVGYYDTNLTPTPNTTFAIDKGSTFGTSPFIRNCLFLGYEDPIDLQSDPDADDPQYCVSEYGSTILSASNTNITGASVIPSEILNRLDETDYRPYPLFAYDTSGVDVSADYTIGNITLAGTEDLYGQTVTSTTTPIGAIKIIPEVPLNYPVKYETKYLQFLTKKKYVTGTYDNQDRTRLSKLIGKNITASNIYSDIQYSSIWDLKDQYTTKQETGLWIFVDREIGLTLDSTYSPSNAISMTNFTDNVNVVFACNVTFPSSLTTTNCCLWEAGGSGIGSWMGIRLNGSTPYFRLRAGEGGENVAGGATPTQNDIALLDITDFPTDGRVHVVVWDIQINPGRVRLWIDGEFKGEGYTTGNGPLESSRWSGGDNAAFMQGSSLVCTGEVNTAWTGTVESGTLLRYYENQLVSYP